MSFDTHLKSHVIGFASREGNREKSQENKKHPIHSYSLQYKPVYEMCNTYLSNGYSVLYGAESIPNKSAEEKVFENIINVDSEVQKYLSKGFLTVINPDSIYEQCGDDYTSIVNFWNSNVNRIQKKLDGKTKGTIIFSAPESYFKHDKHDIFIMFEEVMGKTFPTKSGMICWYKEEWLNSLSLASLIKSLTTHNYVLHNDWNYKAWTENEIINLISEGLDKSLGEGSATLLFATMRTIYKLNQDVVVSRPTVFESILKRLLGNDQQVSVINSISKQIIERIMFCNGIL